MNPIPIKRTQIAKAEESGKLNRIMFIVLTAPITNNTKQVQNVFGFLKFIFAISFSFYSDLYY